MRAICHARVATAQVARASKPSRHVQTGSGNTVPLYDFLVMTFFFVAFFFVTFDGQSVRVLPLIFFVVHPFGGAHAAKVKAHRRPAALHKSTRQGLHHLVVHGAAKQGVGVGDDGHATRRRTVGHAGSVAGHFDGTSGALQQQAFGLRVQFMLLI